MSGSGDIEVLRIIRKLHSRVSPVEVNYGKHMAVHMAAGLLFLGGGRYVLACTCGSDEVMHPSGSL